MDSFSQLRALLDAGHALTYAEARAHLGLSSDRQVRRLFDRLRAEGVPVHRTFDHGPLARFAIPPEHQRQTLDGLSFDAPEVRALAVAASAARAALTGTPHAGPLDSAFRKLLEAAAPVVYLFDVDAAEHLYHFETSPPPDVPASTWHLLETATSERRRIRCDYYTARRDAWTYGREINPYALVRKGRAWFLLGFCHTRSRILTFALEGLANPTLARPNAPGPDFAPPADFDPEAFFRDAFGVMAGGQCYLVRLHVAARVVPYFERRPYHPTQQIEARDAHGALISFEVESLEELRAFVMSWGAAVHVLEPPELRARVAEEVLALALAYAPQVAGAGPDTP